MEQLKRDIYALIMEINQYCDFVLLSKYTHAEEYMVLLIQFMSTVVPQIIKSYDELDILKNLDRMVWAIQLKRILDAMQCDDDYVRIDVLKIEMIDMLQWYLNCVENSDEQSNV